MTSLTEVSSYRVCGVPIAPLSPVDAARVIVQSAVARERLEVHLCNAYTLSLVDQDTALRDALTAADLNLPDGTPVAWMGRRYGTRGPVRGPGLVGEAASQGVDHGVRHFFYGGKDEVAKAMADALARHAPGCVTAGTETPPFRPITDDELDDLAARVRESGAHILWVGLGTPRQDYIVPRLAQRLSMPVVPVGAAFDFWAGEVPEAPRWLHGSGLEWLHRLASEPRRLWARYLLGNPRFIVSAVRHRLSR